jgi:hypothetical protein
VFKCRKARSFSQFDRARLKEEVGQAPLPDNHEYFDITIEPSCTECMTYGTLAISQGQANYLSDFAYGYNDLFEK